MAALHSPKCNDLHDQSDTQFGYTVIVVVGTIISNIPQMYRIARRGSAEGVSSYFLMTGLLSSASSFANIIILSQDIFDCCRSGGISHWECTTGVMGVVNYGVIMLVQATM